MRRNKLYGDLTFCPAQCLPPGTIRQYTAYRAGAFSVFAKEAFFMTGSVRSTIRQSTGRDSNPQTSVSKTDCFAGLLPADRRC